MSSKTMTGVRKAAGASPEVNDGVMGNVAVSGRAVSDAGNVSVAIIPVPLKPTKKQLPEPTERKPTEGTVWTVISIPVAEIGPNPFQPRLSFEADEMSDLIASVKTHGVMQPVTVRKVARSDGADKITSAKADASAKVNTSAKQNQKQSFQPFELIAGERRLRACRAAGRKTIPAIVRDDLSDLQAAELAVVENVQRANLSVIEEARAYKRLMVEFRLKEERIAKKVGKSVQVVRDTLRLLALPEAVQQLLAKRKLSASHGHLLLKLAPFQEICTLVATHVEGSGMTATALSQNLLPNVRQLRDKKLVAELDYRTKFDWKNVCGQCPHKAYFNIGYNSYCAKPEEWARKQTEAIELQKQEAARTLEEARKQSQESGAVDIEMLPSGAYRDLSYGQRPPGCNESCACRSFAVLPHDPTKKRPLCLDPARYDELVKAERAAIAEARRRRYLGFYLEAKSLLVEDEDFREEVVAEERASAEQISREETVTAHSDGDGCAPSELADTRLALVAMAVISGEHVAYLNRERWDGLCREVAQDLSLELPWDQWQSEDGTVAVMLADLQLVRADLLLNFCACLLLGYEALHAIGFGGETPMLSAVLGHGDASQGALLEDEHIDDGSIESDDEMSEEKFSVEDELSAQETDGADFEGGEFEDEQFHVTPLEPRSIGDEPYQSSELYQDEEPCQTDSLSRAA